MRDARSMMMMAMVIKSDSCRALEACAVRRMWPERASELAEWGSYRPPPRPRPMSEAFYARRNRRSNCTTANSKRRRTSFKSIYQSSVEPRCLWSTFESSFPENFYSFLSKSSFSQHVLALGRLGEQNSKIFSTRVRATLDPWIL